ncbi:MAG: DUF1566 domain-containing protein [Deltaproteobacteria bacterium]|nr:DUF1566 domain-containing protein [Deltaproteobacteria bacterium]
MPHFVFSARRVLLLALGAVVLTWALVWPRPEVRADAPAGRYTLTSDTVLDTVTGLLWQRNFPATAQNWSSAGSYCQSLDLGGFASGWRLPTISELESLIDWSRYNAAIDMTAFPGTPGELFWSSNIEASRGDAGPTLGAWGVDFYHGNSKTASLASSGYVRCVR